MLSAVGDMICVRDPKDKPKLTDKFFDIGGTSLTAVLTVQAINERWTETGIEAKMTSEAFLEASSLHEVLVSVFCSETKAEYHLRTLKEMGLTFRPLRDDDMDQVIAICLDSFLNREHIIFALQTAEDLPALLEIVWKALMEWKHYSSILVKEGDESNVQGILLGFDCFNNKLLDAMDDPETRKSITPGWMAVFELMADIEERNIGKYHHHDGTPNPSIYEPFYLAVGGWLSTEDKLRCAQLLETENLEIMKRLNLDGIAAINVNPVTQHLAMENGYERYETMQLNSWKRREDGFRPWHKMSDRIYVTFDVLWQKQTPPSTSKKNERMTT